MSMTTEHPPCEQWHETTDWWNHQPAEVRTVLDFCGTRGGDLHTDRWQRMAELFLPSHVAALTEIADALSAAQDYRSGIRDDEFPSDREAINAAAFLEEDALRSAELVASLIMRGAR